MTAAWSDIVPGRSIDTVVVEGNHDGFPMSARETAGRAAFWKGIEVLA